jgi:hypothetical protein
MTRTQAAVSDGALEASIGTTTRSGCPSDDCGAASPSESASAQGVASKAIAPVIGPATAAIKVEIRMTASSKSNRYRSVTGNLPTRSGFRGELSKFHADGGSQRQPSLWLR